MKQDLSISGDAGQVVAGDVHEGPRAAANGNVMNIRFGAPQEPEKCITDLQRRAISEKVDAVCQVTGMERLDVYRQLFIEFGLEKMMELKRSQFRAATELLDGWLTEAADDATEPDNAAEGSKADTAPQPSRVTDVEVPVGGVYRRELTSLQRQIARLRRRVTVLIAAVIGLVISTGWVMARPDAADHSQPGDGMCLHAGEAHSLGSVIESGGVVLACEPQPDGLPGTWVRQPTGRRK